MTSANTPLVVNTEPNASVGGHVLRDARLYPAAAVEAEEEAIARLEPAEVYRTLLAVKRFVDAITAHLLQEKPVAAYAEAATLRELLAGLGLL